jgi:hypothetical protein
MPIAAVILMVFALVFFLISAFWQSNPPPPNVRPSFLALGLFCWVAAELWMRTAH